MAQAPDFNLSNDVETGKPDGFDSLVADLILAWARFDAGLIFLMADAFELPYRHSRILLGNMDIKTRIARLKKLASHLGVDPVAELMGVWERNYEKMAKPRNTVCHMSYFGSVKSDPERLVFGPGTPEPNDSGASVVVLHADYLRASTTWANQCSSTISVLLQKLREASLSQRAQEKTPSPQEHAGNKP